MSPRHTELPSLTSSLSLVTWRQSGACAWPGQSSIRKRTDQLFAGGQQEQCNRRLASDNQRSKWPVSGWQAISCRRHTAVDVQDVSEIRWVPKGDEGDKYQKLRPSNHLIVWAAGVLWAWHTSYDVSNPVIEGDWRTDPCSYTRSNDVMIWVALNLFAKYTHLALFVIKRKKGGARCNDFISSFPQVQTGFKPPDMSVIWNKKK